jgi:methyltransferase (TIGR00027 family)
MTAIGIAIVRAMESEKPETNRICYDPYARQFVNGALYHFVKFFDRLGYSERKGPGVMGFLTVRERHIDEYLKSCLANGVQQVVILGAGYDARAYRFDEFQHGVKVFEVDHPATQQAKLKRLCKIFGAVPAHVTYVPIDFSTQTLEQRLSECGYDEHATTLFIWQGVTQYLTLEAVENTLAFVVQHSTPGSSIIFDYMYTSLLDGTAQHGEVRQMRRNRWLSNESLTFGFLEGSITAFLEERGFTQVFDANCKYLHDTYFTGANAHRTIADGYAIASAGVKPSAN